MNKSLFVIFALFAVFSSAWCDSSEEVIDKVKSKHLKKYLSSNKDRIDEGFEKLEKYCPKVGDKLKAALISFQECDDKTDESLTICEYIQTAALNCTQPLLKVVDDCLPVKAKGLPILGFKSLLSAADHLCKQTGESIFELANPCLWEDPEVPTAADTACENKIKALIKKYENKENIPTKTEICSTATDLRSCFETQSKASCKNEKTKKAFIGLYDAIIAPCSHLNEA